MVQNGEVVLQADVFRPASQQTRAESMECTDANSHAAEETFNAGSHLARGFVGKRQSQYLIGLNTSLEQSHNAVGDDAGFPGSRAGKNQQRSFKMFNRLMLSISQTGGNGGDFY
jgi:hypothetical protein